MIRDYALMVRAPSQLSLDFLELCVEIQQLVDVMRGTVWTFRASAGGLIWEFGAYQDLATTKANVDQVVQGRAGWVIRSENRALYQGLTEADVEAFRSAFDESESRAV